MTLMNLDQLAGELNAGHLLPSKGTVDAAALTSSVAIDSFSAGYVIRGVGNGLAAKKSAAELAYAAGIDVQDLVTDRAHPHGGAKKKKRAGYLGDGHSR